MMHMKDARNFIANGERLAVSISEASGYRGYEVWSDLNVISQE